MERIDVVDYIRKQKKSILEQLDEIKKINNDENKKNKIDEIYLKTEEIKKYVHQYTPMMIAYDIRICNQMIKELEIEIKNIRSTESDKSFKFTFGLKKNRNKINSTNDKNPHTRTTDNVNLLNINGIKNLNHQDLTLDNIETENKDIVLESLNYCNIRIYGVPTSLRLINLKNCTVFTGPISSSAYIEKCYQCEFKIIAQQIRMHETNECDVYLHITSRTIIEDSTKLRFGAYNWFYDNLIDDFKKSRIDMKTNNWNQIDDFNCPNSPSSNWSLINN